MSETKYLYCNMYGCNKLAKYTLELEHEDGFCEVSVFCKEYSESMCEDDGFLGWKIIGYWEYVTA